MEFGEKGGGLSGCKGCMNLWYMVEHLWIGDFYWVFMI